MRSSLAHLFSALVICGIAFVGYGAWYMTVVSLSSTAADLQNQIDAKTESASRIASARAAIAEIGNDEAVVQNYVVSEDGVVAFITDLEARGKALGAVVDVLSVSKGTEGARTKLVFLLAVKGTFDAVMRTLGSIEYAPYDLSLSGVLLGQDAKDSWHADLKLLVGSTSASTTKNML